jgi:hypothetical protein
VGELHKEGSKGIVGEELLERGGDGDTPDVNELRASDARGEGEGFCFVEEHYFGESVKSVAKGQDIYCEITRRDTGE